MDDKQHEDEAEKKKLDTLLGSKAYGFICAYEDLETRLKGGKALVTLDAATKLLPPLKLTDKETDLLAMVSRQGKLLIYPAKELPELSKGKGNKLLSIPGGKLDAGLDGLAAAAIVPQDCGITLHCGRRVLKLSAQDLQVRQSSRSKSGTALPRGFQKVDYIAVDAAAGTLRTPEGRSSALD